MERFHHSRRIPTETENLDSLATISKQQDPLYLQPVRNVTAIQLFVQVMGLFEHFTNKI